MIVLEFLLVPR